jgi:hypothetical protein
VRSLPKGDESAAADPVAQLPSVTSNYMTEGYSHEEGVVGSGLILSSASSPLLSPVVSPLSPSPLSPHVVSYVTAFDWLELGGILDVSGADDQQFFLLDKVVDDARVAKREQGFNLAKRPVLVFPSGIGTGGQARLPYRLEWAGVTFAFANRPATERSRFNFYCKIPGEACLIHGAIEAKDAVLEMLEAMGLRVSDLWVRRADVCQDAPGLNLRDVLYPAFMDGRFVSTATRWNPWTGVRGPTGFTIQGSSVSLNVYDKRMDVMTRHTELYAQAMVQRRWGGVLPDAATRIEYRIRKTYLDSFGLKTFDQVIERLPDVFARLSGDEARPFFRMTQTKVNRANGHQSRSETLPLWQELMTSLCQSLSERREPLKPIDRKRITGKRAFGIIKGLLVGYAASKNEIIENLDDAIHQLRLLHELNAAVDEDWAKSWTDKARKFETLDTTMGFPTAF